MGKIEFRILIKHYFLRGKTIAQTEASLQKYYPDSTSSHGMTHKWFTEFRCGRPKDVITEEIINKIHDMVLDDPKVKEREIAKATDISIGSVVSVSHEELHMRKLTAR